MSTAGAGAWCRLFRAPLKSVVIQMELDRCLSVDTSPAGGDNADIPFPEKGSDMGTAARFIAVTAVMAVALSFAPAAKPQAEKRGCELQFELADGTVITGRIDAGTIAIRIATGNVLKIPVAAVKELTVGLNDRPGFVRRVDALFKALDSDETHEAAQRELIALGPAAAPLLKCHITGNYVWPAVRQVLNAYKTWSKDHPDASEVMVRPYAPRSKIRTRINTFAGTVAVDEFRLAGPYGPLTVKLDDVRRIRSAIRITVPKRRDRWDVELRDRTHIRGTATGQSLRIKTRYGTMVVPPARIQLCAFGDAGKRVRAECWGSDRIAGSIGPKTIVSLKTLKGKVDIPVGKIATVAYWPVTFTGHTTEIFHVAFSPDGKSLAAGSMGKTIKLWDIATGKELHTLKGHSRYVSSVAFAPDGKSLASASPDKTIKLWDTGTGKELLTLEGHSKGVSSVAFSADGKYLASGSLDKIIKLWSPAGGWELLALKGHSHYVLSVAFSPDGKSLASGSRDETIKIWDLEGGKERLTLKTNSGSAWSVVFSPDGKRLASGHTDGTVKIWNAVTGKELLALKGRPRPSGSSIEVKSVAFSPDGRSLASGSLDHTIKLWDAIGGRKLLTIKGHASSVYSVVFSPDGKSLASGSWDTTVKLWDVPDWTTPAKR